MWPRYLMGLMGGGGVRGGAARIDILFVLFDVLFYIYLVTTGILRAGRVTINPVSLANNLVIFPMDCVVGSIMYRM